MFEVLRTQSFGFQFEWLWATDNPEFALGNVERTWFEFGLEHKKIGLFHFDFMRERHDINTSDFNFITFLRFSQLWLGNSILIDFFKLNIKHFPCFDWINQSISSKMFEFFLITSQHAEPWLSSSIAEFGGATASCKRST